MFRYDPKKNKVLLSEYFKNVRLHYLDLRDYFEETYYDVLSEVNNIANIMISTQYIDEEKLKLSMELISKFSTYCQMVLSVIISFKKQNNKSNKKIKIIKYQNEEMPIHGNQEKQNKIFTENIEYLMNKMFNRYKYDNIKSKLRKNLDTLEKYLEDLISTSNFLINQFTTILNTINKSTNKLTMDINFVTEYTYGLSFSMYSKMLYSIKDGISILMNKYTYFFTRFMDVYFLRRFLDKDYITNAITYTGSHHSNVYIEILIKDFDFKISHVSYSKITNLKELNKKIIKMDAPALGEIFYPPIKSQCSDLTKFPKNFL
jgi:hypothetical protein